MSEEDIDYTVEEGFRMFASSLELTPDDYATVSNRQFEVETCLARYIDTFVTVLPDAYARKTMSAPLKDNIVDMLVVFRQEHSHRYKPDELLEKLFVTLRHIYPNIEMDADENGLSLPFPEFTFRIKPGFFAGENSYLVPVMHGKDWEMANPGAYQQQLALADRNNRGLLLPVVKMLKCWNRSIDNIFHGLYLELLAKEILNDVPVSSHVSAIRHVLDKGKMKVVFRAEDPFIKGAQVDGLEDVSAVVQAMLHFQNAYGVSSAAVHHERRGNINQAYREWAKIFPGYFPEPVSMVIKKLQESNIEGVRALEIMRDHMRR